MDEPISRDLAQLLDRAVAAGMATGWSALAWQDDGAGLAWHAGRCGLGLAAVDEATRFDLASLTKPLVITSLLLLAMRDGLELEMSLADLLPELAATPWAEVTVEQCACHTAGFPAWAPLYARGLGRDAYLAALAATPPVAPAGSRVEYSCLGFVALGIGLERAAGAPLAEVFAESVVTPLALDGTLAFALPAGSAVAAGETAPFVERRLLAERGVAAEPPPAPTGVIGCADGNARGLGGIAGNAGLFGTAAAVAALAAEFLPGGGELFTADEVAVATACRTAGREQARSLGWQCAATPGCSAGPGLPPEAVGHVGFTGTSVWIDPRSRRVLVLLANRLHPGGRTADLHPARRRFHALAMRALDRTGGRGR